LGRPNAGGLIKHAKKERTAVTTTDDTWDAGYDAGWDHGYDDGFGDGYRDGQEDAREDEHGAIADDRGAWWPCKWCGRRADCYRVSDELWRTYGPPAQGWLCLECFEDRLGRPLSRDDLVDCACSTGAADNVWANIVAREAVAL
jgi:hypothetical protein